MNFVRFVVLSVVLAGFASLALGSVEPYPGVKLPDWTPYVAGLAYASLETWLGKTDKVKSGSVLEMVGRGLLGVFKLLAGTKPK